MAGTPFCLAFLLFMLEICGVMSVPKALFISLLVVSAVAGFLSPDFYRVVKHGHSEDALHDEKDSAEPYA